MQAAFDIYNIRPLKVKAGGSTIRCAIFKLIIAIWNKEELPGEWKESIIVLIPTTYKILSNILLSRLIPYAEEIIGIINVDSDAIGQIN